LQQGLEQVPPEQLDPLETQSPLMQSLSWPQSSLPAPFVSLHSAVSP